MIKFNQTRNSPNITYKLGQPELNTNEPINLNVESDLLLRFGRFLASKEVSIRDIFKKVRDDRPQRVQQTERGLLATGSSGRSEFVLINPAEIAEIFPELINYLTQRYGILDPEDNQVKLPKEIMFAIKGTGTGPAWPIDLAEFIDGNAINGFTARDENDILATQIVEGDYPLHRLDGEAFIHTYKPVRIVIAIFPIKEIHFKNENKRIEPTEENKWKEPLVAELMIERGGHNFRDLKEDLKEHEILEYFMQISKNDEFFRDEDRLSYENLILRAVEKYWYDSQVEALFYSGTIHNRSLQNMTFLGWKDLDDISKLIKDPSRFLRQNTSEHQQLTLELFLKKIILLIHLIPVNLCKLVISKIDTIIPKSLITDRFISIIAADFLTKKSFKPDTSGTVAKVELILNFLFKILEEEHSDSTEMRSEILKEIFIKLLHSKFDQFKPYFEMVLEKSFNLGSNRSEVLAQIIDQIFSVTDGSITEEEKYFYLEKVLSPNFNIGNITQSVLIYTNFVDFYIFDKIKLKLIEESNRKRIVENMVDSFRFLNNKSNITIEKYHYSFTKLISEVNIIMNSDEYKEFFFKILDVLKECIHPKSDEYLNEYLILIQKHHPQLDQDEILAKCVEVSKIINGIREG